MRKLFSFLMIFSLIFSLSLPVFAEDSEPSEPSASVSEPSESGSEGDTEGGDTSIEPEPSEPSESGSGSSGVGTTVINMDGATVNVSDESVNAIANAVVEASEPDYLYDYQYFLNLDDGRTLIVDTNVSELTSRHLVVFASSTEYKIVYSSVGSDLTITYGSSWKINSSSTYYTNGSVKISINDVINGLPYSFKDMTACDGEIATSSYSFNKIIYSNRNVYNKSGQLIYESSETYRTISFDTGFDDLVIEPVLSLDFVAPEIEYEGYRFDGWYLDKDFSLPYVVGYKFTSDTTLYAKWIPYRTISFVTGLEDFTLESVQVLSGEAYTPPVFSYAGFEFIGAYTDEDFKNQFVGGTVVEEDLTLYLRFEPIVYDYGALMSEQLERMEVFIYVQMATIVVLAVMLIGFFFFRKQGGLGV